MRDYSGQIAPYLSREAAQLLVARDISHLIVDLPSIDRTHDEGRLTAHRIFFGLPRGAVQLDEASGARRPSLSSPLCRRPFRMARA